MTADLILCGISLAFILIGGWFMNKAAHLILHGEKAAATIIENTFKKDRKGGVYYPVV